MTSRCTLRSTLESYFNRRWYPSEVDVARNLTWLSPLSMLYAAIVKRKLAQRTRLNPQDPHRPNAMIIVIGNLTVGGAGKTPLTIALASQLLERGLTVGVISRGYGGSFSRAHSGARFVEKNDPASLVGDEPLIIAQQLGIPIAIARQRCDALQLLLQHHPVDVVISDDGLQHYALPRDFEVVVIDASRGLGNGELIPQGPLREPVKRIGLADVIVANGQLTDSLKLELQSFKIPCMTMQAEASGIRALNPMADANSNHRVKAGLPEPVQQATTVYLVAGIGNPEKFFSQAQQWLRRQGCNAHFQPVVFPDHHHYTLDDLNGLDAASVDASNTAQSVILVTEKDAVKLNSIATQCTTPLYAMGLEVSLDPSLTESITQQLAQLRTVQQTVAP